MKEGITVETLRARVAQYIALEKDEDNRHDSVEWSYVMLEPDLLFSHEVTLAYLKEIEKEEFDAIAECFDDIVREFKSVEILETIHAMYIKFYGDNTDTELYRTEISHLSGYIKD